MQLFSAKSNSYDKGSYILVKFIKSCLFSSLLISNFFCSISSFVNSSLSLFDFFFVFVSFVLLLLGFSFFFSLSIFIIFFCSFFFFGISLVSVQFKSLNLLTIDFLPTPNSPINAII